MRDVKAMVTGHRTIANADAVLNLLIHIITTYESRGVNIIGISGGAAGADTLWARACHAANHPFVLEVPNRYYFRQYRESSKEEVAWLTEHAAEINHTVDVAEVENWRTLWGTQKWWKHNFARNRAMIRDAEIYIAVSNEEPIDYVNDRSIKGGTAACIRDLHAARKNIIWVSPDAPGVVARRYPYNS